ncbi:MAG: hypothetical protein Q7S06_02885 [Nanoarchaeota archaeon]|nr:hypothetical protein [Nanoarchaeota archaeon]
MIEDGAQKYCSGLLIHRVSEIERTLREGFFQQFMSAMGEYMKAEEFVRKEGFTKVTTEARSRIYEAMRKCETYPHLTFEL